ncbi:hypothetical protein CAEBREN_22588 [Caenorhabditis brenneri]|uniref:Uncharacterized protein n=1 Tax=Caenorhabditis brenneri TaxID=135651 RepID=G0MGJ4_CAEBE|nr:hypothetical protein CAEBREN_22588 [Caenorhabditis brenneri]
MNLEKECFRQINN